jgi:hypothetical protein
MSVLWAYTDLFNRPFSRISQPSIGWTHFRKSLFWRILLDFVDKLHHFLTLTKIKCYLKPYTCFCQRLKLNCASLAKYLSMQRVLRTDIVETNRGEYYVADIYFNSYVLRCCVPTGAMTSSFLRYLNYKEGRTTVGRTLLDEWSAHRKDLYLTAHSAYKRKMSMIWRI